MWLEIEGQGVYFFIIQQGDVIMAPAGANLLSQLPTLFVYGIVSFNAVTCIEILDKGLNRVLSN